MVIKGPSLSKEISTTAVVSKDPIALVNAYAYSVFKEGAVFSATVAELPSLRCQHANPIEAQNGLKQIILAKLTGMQENERPIPKGIHNKTAIDKAKAVPAHIRKAYGRAQK